MLRSLAVCLTSIFDHHLDNLLSLFVSTTEELQRPLHRLLFCLLWFPVALVILLCLMPVGLLGWTLWFLVSNRTKTLRVSCAIQKREDGLLFHDRADGRNGFVYRKVYNIMTVNTCLQSDFLSRVNNISRPEFRAKRIGNILSGLHRPQANDSHDEGISSEQVTPISISQQTLSFDHSMDFIAIPEDYCSTVTHTPVTFKMSSAKEKSATCYDVINHDILCQCPELDFLLAQEVFSPAASRTLVKSLHRRFPFIVYDGRQDGFTSNLWSLGSGLLIASRYPISHANFSVFRHKDGFARVSSLGILQAKIRLGSNHKGKQLVGYITNTHLQPYQGDSPVHWAQLLQVRAACATMRTVTATPNDIIVFDIVGGDFNLDNMSPADQLERTHPLFEEYIDVCRQNPGTDKPWTVGSEMRHPPFHDRLVHTPEGLRHALLTPELRTRYILDADIMRATKELTNTMPPVDDVGQVYVRDTSGRRRVDYLLYNKERPLTVTSYNAITELAGLTDHICFSMTFSPSLST